METWRFADRRQAGQVLARQLGAYAGRADVLVLGLPRGGVPVAAEVARALGAPLDVFTVRKLGVPGHEELAMGAVASDGTVVLDPQVVGGLGIDRTTIDRTLEAERRELRRREEAYRDGRPSPQLGDRTVILVDDGLATGSSMRAAALAAREQRPARLVIAVPVAPRRTCEAPADVADDVVCAATPEPFQAVGQWYDDFSPTSDDEVRSALRTIAERPDDPGA